MGPYQEAPALGLTKDRPQVQRESGTFTKGNTVVGDADFDTTAKVSEV